MNRLFLAFMALLAGLLAQGGPAHARDCPAGTTQVGALQVPSVQAVTAAQAKQSGSSTSRGEAPAAAASAPLALAQPVLIPTVHLGIDRARE